MKLNLPYKLHIYKKKGILFKTSFGKLVIHIQDTFSIQILIFHYIIIIHTFFFIMQNYFLVYNPFSTFICNNNSNFNNNIDSNISYLDKKN